MATMTPTPSGGGAGSNVHEAFALMASLIHPRIPVRYLDLCTQILQRRQMETVFEERAVQKLCAFPTCGHNQHLTDRLPAIDSTTGKFRVSLARREIYEAHHEKQFCSQLCLKVDWLKARVLLSRLASKPPQLLPSMLEVFGTDKPNPFDYEHESAATAVAISDSKAAEGVSKPTQPNVQTVWAKTTDLGVVERQLKPQNTLQMAVPSALEATTSAVKENATPAPPDRNFPTTEQAVLIEGFVFPAHKKRLAKKVEKLVKKSQEEGDEDDELVVSDSDESDAAGSEASSTGSFELSDFDEDEVVTPEDLSLFSNLWRLFSTWITHETTLVVAGLPLSAKAEEDLNDHYTAEGMGKQERELMRRRARQIFMERWNSLSLVLHRPLPHVALKLKLASDRYANHRIDNITQTFALHDAIDSRNSRLVRRAKELTKLDPLELQLLLQLFYEVRDESAIAVDTDENAAVEEEVAEAEKLLKEAGLGDKSPAICRKCRRSSSKCVCHVRAKAPKDEEVSASQVETLLQEALAIREEFDELLNPEEH
ncbi:hypothetical protein BBJ28_00021180 [Nothophytophthora sp. Chile5]|nr:hypothetical protein BBJ28_00021180 [Nothophytophthora sp. Chile5]